MIDFDLDSRFQGVRLDDIDFNDTSTLKSDPLVSPTDGGTVDLITNSFRYRITVTPFTGQVTVAAVPGG